MAGSAIDCPDLRQGALVRRRARGVIFVSILMALFYLSGCAHYFYLTADDFHRGAGSNIQFQRDDARCTKAAAVRQNEVGGGDPRGAYNTVYATCMERRGHPPSNIDLLGIGG